MRKGWGLCGAQGEFRLQPSSSKNQFKDAGSCLMLGQRGIKLGLLVSGGGGGGEDWLGCSTHPSPETSFTQPAPEGEEGAPERRWLSPRPLGFLRFY